MTGQSSGVWVPRDIDYHPSFESQAAAIERDTHILDEKLLDLTFNIARVPELYELHRRSGRLPLCAAYYLGNPRLRVWFTYDDHTVTLLGIERV